MKRVTIALDDEVHASLVDYARDRSKNDLSPFNLSSAVRKLLAEKLGELGYFPLADKVLNKSIEKESKLENTRSSLKSYCDILYSFSIKGARPVYITCKANLSWTVMKEYLKSLESLGFITGSTGDEKRIYQLSHTGFRMLKQYLEVGN